MLPKSPPRLNHDVHLNPCALFIKAVGGANLWAFVQGFAGCIHISGIAQRKYVMRVVDVGDSDQASWFRV